MSNLPQPRRTLRRDAAAAVRECAGWNVRLAARRITAFLDARLKPSGLSLAQFSLMALVAAADDDRMGALAERAGLDPSTLSRNLDALARAGWVEVATVEDDRRRRAVWLTEAGALKLEAAMPVWREAHAALATVVDASLARALADASAGLAEA